MKNEILKILKENKDKWVKGSTIKKQLNLRDLQELRAYIKELRQEEHMIIASNKGYMLTNNVEKAQEYFHRRVVEMGEESRTLLMMMGKYEEMEKKYER